MFSYLVSPSPPFGKRSNTHLTNMNIYSVKPYFNSANKHIFHNRIAITRFSTGTDETGETPYKPIATEQIIGATKSTVSIL